MNLISKFMRLKSESFTEIHLRENAHPRKYVSLLKSWIVNVVLSDPL